MNPALPNPGDALQQALRSELPFVAVTAIVLAVGLAAVLLWQLRSHDPLLLWLGILSLLYGLRLFVANGLIRFALGLDTDTQRELIDIITFCIGIPFVLFFREWLGSQWRKAMTALLWTGSRVRPVGHRIGSDRAPP